MRTRMPGWTAVGTWQALIRLLVPAFDGRFISVLWRLPRGANVLGIIYVCTAPKLAPFTARGRSMSFSEPLTWSTKLKISFTIGAELKARQAATEMQMNCRKQQDNNSKLETNPIREHILLHTCVRVCECVCLWGVDALCHLKMAMEPVQLLPRARNLWPWHDDPKLVNKQLLTCLHMPHPPSSSIVSRSNCICVGNRVKQTTNVRRQLFGLANHFWLGRCPAKKINLMRFALIPVPVLTGDGKRPVKDLGSGYMTSLLTSSPSDTRPVSHSVIHWLTR